jgi:hypothetical protein
VDRVAESAAGSHVHRPGDHLQFSTAIKLPVERQRAAALFDYSTTLTGPKEAIDIGDCRFVEMIESPFPPKVRVPMLPSIACPLEVFAIVLTCHAPAF